MNDPDLERKIDSARDAIKDSELHPDHKEALQESLDQAAKCSNGSPEKLHDLTVAFCKSVIRATRSDISFKSRVADAVQEPLDKMRDEIVASVTKLVQDHVLSCPIARGEAQKSPTWKDVAMAAAKNKYTPLAVAAAVFSPNIIGIIELFKK